jgi:hypothetical protein
MNKLFPVILNIAAGKLQPLDLDQSKRFFIINLDPMYFDAVGPIDAEIAHKKRYASKQTAIYCNYDAYEFMERTRITFDRVCIYRFLEHVPMDKVLYFIYLISTITATGSEVDVIVPNYNRLAGMILHEDVNSVSFEERNILLTTELLNEPSCPHASIWTAERAKYFWELEGRFKVKVIIPSFDFDGRDIYIRFKAVKL